MNNSREVLKARYFQPGESWLQLCRRVADISRTEKGKSEMFSKIHSAEFLPNSPMMMNAGTRIPQLCACYVLPVRDDMEEIFDSVKHAALIHKSGGGTGFDFSSLRPAGSYINSSGGQASGPVSFMKVFDTATDQIKQGGRRKGANMGVLSAEHPDIRHFIQCKETEQDLTNFNISVMLSDRVRHEDPTIVKHIANCIWRNGEPGLLFSDNMNADRPHSELYTATNPCGESLLLPYESCCLGSINLPQFVHRRFDWHGLYETAYHAARFLDSAIDATYFPLQAIRDRMNENRKIGLGAMGLADVLISFGLPYDSTEGRDFAESIYAMMYAGAEKASRDLADEYGAIYKDRRNSLLLSSAPTGSLSLIGNATAGIEPVFSFAQKRNVMEGEVYEYNQQYFDALRRCSAYGYEDLPDDLQQVFKTAQQISPVDHIRMQAAVQNQVDQAVSKTINLPHDINVDEIEDCVHAGADLGLKGMTMYRNGSRETQVYECTECKI